MIAIAAALIAFSILVEVAVLLILQAKDEEERRLEDEEFVAEMARRRGDRT